MPRKKKGLAASNGSPSTPQALRSSPPVHQVAEVRRRSPSRDAPASRHHNRSAPRRTQPSFGYGGASPFGNRAFTYVDSTTCQFRKPSVPTTSSPTRAFTPTERTHPKRRKPNTGDLCLTMWQPWASLLVAGIKTVEGRSWFSEHRGRLWISSASRKLDREELASLEWQYRGCGKPFPDKYPTSALLGCIDVVDCLSQANYREQYPDGEENCSEYVFVCKSPRTLPLPLAQGGDHKIWRLPPEVYATAKNMLADV